MGQASKSLAPHRPECGHTAPLQGNWEIKCFGEPMAFIIEPGVVLSAGVPRRGSKKRVSQW